MSWSFFIAYTTFICFAMGQQSLTRSARRQPGGLLLALELSGVLATITMIALLGMLFLSDSWYWTPVTFFGSFFIGGFGMYALTKTLGSFPMALIGFGAWPAAAIWAYFLLP